MDGMFRSTVGLDLGHCLLPSNSILWLVHFAFLLWLYVCLRMLESVFIARYLWWLWSWQYGSITCGSVVPSELYYVIESNILMSHDVIWEQLFFHHHGEICSPDQRNHVLIEAQGKPAKYKLLLLISYAFWCSDCLRGTDIYLEPGWKQLFPVKSGALLGHHVPRISLDSSPYMLSICCAVLVTL